MDEKTFFQQSKNALFLKGLSVKDKFFYYWFVIAVCLLFVTDDAPIWFYAVEIINAVIPGIRVLGMKIPDYFHEYEEDNLE